MSSTEKSPTGRTSLDRRWWWQPAVLIVVGAVVVSYQYDAWSSGEAEWFNLAVGAIGATTALYGVYELVQAWRARSAAPPEDEAPADEA